MNCPNCDARVAEQAVFCPDCGYAFESDKQGAGSKNSKNKPARKRKIFISAIVVLILIIAAVITFIILSGNNGSKTAEKLSGGIGKNIFDVSKNIDAALLAEDDVSPDYLKGLEVFDKLCKSDKIIEVSGVNVPEWVIYCSIDSEDKLTDVKYYNFDILKKNWKGLKAKEKIDIKNIQEGATIKEIEDQLKLEPLSITYSEKQTVYKYKYYFINLDKNETCHYITITYNDKDRVETVTEEENTFISEMLT